MEWLKLQVKIKQKKSSSRNETKSLDDKIDPEDLNNSSIRQIFFKKVKEFDEWLLDELGEEYGNRDSSLSEFFED